MRNVADDQITRATGRAQSPRWNHHMLPSHTDIHSQRSPTSGTISNTHNICLKVKSTQQTGGCTSKLNKHKTQNPLMQKEIRGLLVRWDSASPNQMNINIVWWSRINHRNECSQRQTYKEIDQRWLEWVSASKIWITACGFSDALPKVLWPKSADTHSVWFLFLSSQNVKVSSVLCTRWLTY